uniref:C2 Aida-type domain-containing protein n=1 Tax=Chromera velia CCMP2878 TaxID=1169474 RepID=A0A0G4FC74_9ALVE|eukprot:Cvel_3065.t1-p1 / transcript=Cvel_3065.t1 / gene=Cvel_3065 / organism=Chromera_velia_CCMP2878 / gene_product=Axin interactor, dorsalization-associated protein, putative / transcript_product=Axin interactor, dorsalization-associated protein, putative / location=Cvel_scaffold122:79558-80484(+) / protein_length=309 / sequence_SO=supercontig / SO=protein_coding / is_pseudo=false
MDPNNETALRKQWTTLFKQAVDEDSWGQVVEAQEHYVKLGGLITAKSSAMQNVASADRDLMNRLALCLSARAKVLRSTAEATEKDISHADMKLLSPFFEKLFVPSAGDTKIPIPSSKYESAPPCKPVAVGIVLSGDDDEPVATGGGATQMPAESVIKAAKSVGGTLVAVRIDRIGLKDAQVYINPTMTVIVADQLGTSLDTQDTPVAVEKRVNHVVFNNTVYLRVSLEQMQKEGCGIFFEFKHFKPKKNKMSVRCWAFMEMAELRKDEEIVLEIYHKPTDLRKRRLRLHSEKDLFLHVFPTFVKGGGGT